ncbi:MAG: 4-hydroxy-tetrahydrodipicolinate synthase [Lachnospiraceae bacterium]|nr:4-hydroxy-tetrahydrodipicolinate synthase [Lachnospiraceae bacterium]
MEQLFRGAGVAIITPMKDNGDVNYDKLEELVEFHIKGGTDSIIVCGTTGESATLTMEEHRNVIAQTVKFAKGRIPVIAGAGSNATATAIQHAQEAEADGADGLLIVTPYYNKATQGGLIRHYSTIADSTKLPIIVYSVPSRTGTNVLPETMATLFKEKENIVGLKEATGNMAQASKTMYLTDGKLDMYSGEDGLVVPLMAIGAIGVISVISNIAPQETHDMCQAFLNGDLEKARQMQMKSLPLVDALFSEVNPIPVKKAMNLMGMEVGPLRAPLYEMTEENTKKLEAEMKKFGLL